MRSPSRDTILLCVLLAAAAATPFLLREARLRELARKPPVADPVFTLEIKPSFLDAPENADLFSSGGAERGTPPGDASPRVVFIGFDGMAWDILIPMLHGGQTPHLEALARRGVVGTLSTLRPTTSPALWTSMATGVRPERHGVLSFQKVRDGKRTKDIYTSRDRRVRALWNVLSEAGRRSLLVNYYNTYPVEPVEGMVVSNFLRHAQMLVWFRPEAVSLDVLSRGAMVRPASALDRVLALRPLEAEISAAAETLMGGGAASSKEEKRGLDYMRFFMEADMLSGRAAITFYPEERPDFAAVFFQGADVAQHYFYLHHWERHSGNEKTRRALRRKDSKAYDWHLANVPRYAEAVREYYRRLDSWLGDFLNVVGSDAVVMVVSDHGVDAAPRTGPRTGGHDAAPPGIFIMAGPGVTHGRVEGATVYDIAPTLMAAMGMPVARDLDGKVLEAAFQAEFLTRFPVKYVDTYETSPRELPDDVSIPSEAKEEYEKELKSLGYIR